MESTVYKPSIYNAPTIYKTGDEGGGGGSNINLDNFELLDDIYMASAFNFTTSGYINNIDGFTGNLKNNGKITLGLIWNGSSVGPNGCEALVINNPGGGITTNSKTSKVVRIWIGSDGDMYVLNGASLGYVCNINNYFVL